MKLKTMDIQKFLLTGWYPKMAYNVLGIYAVPLCRTQKFSINLNRVLHIYLVSKR